MVETDIVQELVKLLLTKTSVTNKVGLTGLTSWIFQDKLFVPVEKSQSAALVVSQVGGWAVANEHNTARFPRLSVQYFVDPLRDSNGVQSKFADTRLRANELFNLADKILHRPQGAAQMLGSLRVDSVLRLTEPTWYEVPDGDGMLRGQAFYAACLG